MPRGKTLAARSRGLKIPKKGERFGGRQKGTPNKTTRELKEAILLADRVVVMTPGPGRIQSDNHVALPRPRDVASPEFNAIRRELSQLLVSHHGMKAPAMARSQLLTLV